MTSPARRASRTIPDDSVRIVGTLVAVWVCVQLIGLVVGLGLIGRHGAGPARHVDVGIHDWFVAHRVGMVDLSKVVAFVGDAPKLGVIVVVATLIAFGVGVRRGTARWRTLGPLAAYLGAEATVYVVRIIIHRPRPVTANFPNPGALSGVHETSWSFPSGHATASMAVLVALAGMLVLRHRSRWLYALAVVLGLLVAATRLMLGVHWFTDVATGAVLGGVWGGTVCWGQARIDAGVDSSA